MLIYIKRLLKDRKQWHRRDTSLFSYFQDVNKRALNNQRFSCGAWFYIGKYWNKEQSLSNPNELRGGRVRSHLICVFLCFWALIHLHSKLASRKECFVTETFFSFPKGIKSIHLSHIWLWPQVSIKWTTIVEQQVMVWCTDGECKMQSELQIARQTINNLYVLHLHHLLPFPGFKASGPFCWPYLTFSQTADVCNSKKVFWKGWKFYWSVFMSYRQQPYPLPAGTILWAAPQGSWANLSYPKVTSRQQTCH